MKSITTSIWGEAFSATLSVYPAVLLLVHCCSICFLVQKTIAGNKIHRVQWALRQWYLFTEGQSALIDVTNRVYEWLWLHTVPKKVLFYITFAPTTHVSESESATHYTTAPHKQLGIASNLSCTPSDYICDYFAKNNKPYWANLPQRRKFLVFLPKPNSPLSDQLND